MKKPHKHAEVIKQWADGSAVQYFIDNRWHDMMPHATPSFSTSIDWRAKPEPRKVWYRVAVWADGSAVAANTERDEYFFEKSRHFRRWLTPRTEYEVD